MYKGSKLFHVCLLIIMTKSFEFVMKLDVKITSVLNDRKKINVNVVISDFKTLFGPVIKMKLF